MTDTGKKLLQAILDKPDSDEERYAYASWLDEQGESRYAEFIRVQCELAKLPDRNRSEWERGYCTTCGEEENLSSHYHCGECGELCGMMGCGKTECADKRFQRAKLEDRVKNLWGSWPDEDDVRSKIHATMPPGVEWCILPESLVDAEDRHIAIVRRGFIDEIHCHLEYWNKYGQDITKAHPVKYVSCYWSEYKTNG